MSEEMHDKYFLACLVAMHAIAGKAPLVADSDLPKQVVDGATDYATILMSAVYGDDWQSR